MQFADHEIRGSVAPGRKFRRQLQLNKRDVRAFFFLHSTFIRTRVISCAIELVNLYDEALDNIYIYMKKKRKRRVWEFSFENHQNHFRKRSPNISVIFFFIRVSSSLDKYWPCCFKLCSRLAVCVRLCFFRARVLIVLSDLLVSLVPAVAYACTCALRSVHDDFIERSPIYYNTNTFRRRTAGALINK